MSKTVTVNTAGGTPTIAIDVGGVARTATYASGSGTNALTFTYTPTIGDVDLDGIAVSSPVVLNGGTIKDSAGNDAVLTFTPPNTSGVKINYPSLGMDFVYDADGRYTLNGTAYDTLPAFLTATGGTFTRSSIATYYDAAGVLQTAAANTPRFDFDPVTHAAKGILIEESRANLLKRSSELDNAVWGGSVAITANAAQAPDGTMTAEKLIESATTGCQTWIQGSSASGTRISGSVYLKAAERTKGALGFWNGTTWGGGICGGANRHVLFDLSGGTIIASDSADVNGTIQPVGNGWYKVTVTSLVTMASGTQIRISTAPNSATLTSNLSYSGDGTSGIYAWGAQLEQGAFPTSYIPTTTAAVTRAADNLNIPVGPWFIISGGSTFVKTAGCNNSLCIPISIDINGNNNLGMIFGSTTTEQRMSNSFTLSSGGVTGLGGFANGTSNGGGGFLYGPEYPVDSIHLGRGNATAYLNTGLRQFKYYPVNIQNTQLQLMTQ